MRKLLAALLSTVMLLAATTAMAIPITGSVNFIGNAVLTTDVPNPGNIGIHFVDLTTYTFFPQTGTYTGIGIVPVTFKDFAFSPTLTPSSVEDLWSFTGVNSVAYSFDLTSLTTVTNTSSLLQLIGTGVLKANGYDDTLGTWNFTDQGGDVAVAFSATATPAPVPEPSTMVLLSAGLLGLAIYSKRRMNVV